MSTTAKKKLDGRIAIVTGSDSGIGQAIAVAFAREGAQIAVTYNTDKKGAEATLRQVEAAGSKGFVTQLDVCQTESIVRLFRETRQELGLPNILVNNAGVGGARKPVLEMAQSDWEHTLRVNLTGPFLCCQQFLQGLNSAQGEHGVIINVTSVHEEIAAKGGADYDAAKGGLRNLTRTLALELADKNIRINNLAPGMILTPMNQKAIDDPAVREKAEKRIPVGHAGVPEDIAKAALYLASDDSSYVHGTTLFVDGALTQAVGQGA